MPLTIEKSLVKLVEGEGGPEGTALRSSPPDLGHEFHRWSLDHFVLRGGRYFLLTRRKGRGRTSPVIKKSSNRRSSTREFSFAGAGVSYLTSLRLRVGTVSHIPPRRGQGPSNSDDMAHKTRAETPSALPKLRFISSLPQVFEVCPFLGDGVCVALLCSPRWCHAAQGLTGCGWWYAVMPVQLHP